MDPLSGQLQCRPGDEVYTSDESKLGKVLAFDAKIITVERGLLSKSRYYVPTGAVNACDAGKVYLNVAKANVAGAGWDAPPPLTTEADGVPVPGLPPRPEG